MYYIYINLDNKTERKKHMEDLLSNLNLNYEISTKMLNGLIS